MDHISCLSMVHYYIIFEKTSVGFYRKVIQRSNLAKHPKTKNNITQEDLGKLLNVTQSTIAYYQLGKKQRLSLYEINQREPDLTTTKQLADFFNVTIDYLVGHDNIESLSPATEEDNSNDLIKFLERPKILWHH